jgi:hypothetical protein
MQKESERSARTAKQWPIVIVAVALTCPYAQAIMWIPRQGEIQVFRPSALYQLNSQPNAYGFSAYKTREGKIILVGPNDGALHSLWEFWDVLEHPLSEEEYRERNHIAAPEPDR